MMRSLQALAKLLPALWCIWRGYWRVRTVFQTLTPSQRAREVEAWSRQMLQCLGITVQSSGQPAAGPVLMAANHISWLDILVLHSACHCRFVAKSDIGQWPLLGVMTSGGDSLYIERSSNRDALRVVHQMAAALQAGDVLAVFPEGGTGNGVVLHPFHGNLLQAAITAQAPVQPVAVRFTDAGSGEQSFAPCYHANDTLLGSFWRTLCAPPLLAQVRYGAVQHDNGRSRRVWAADLRADVQALLE